MPIYLISIPGSEEDSSYPVRADDAAEAADLYVQACLREDLVIFDADDLEEAGEVSVLSLLQDDVLSSGQKGVIPYDQPEVSEIKLSEIKSWRDFTSGVSGADPDF